MIPFASAARPRWGEPKEVRRWIAATFSVAAGPDARNRQPTSGHHKVTGQGRRLARAGGLRPGWKSLFQHAPVDPSSRWQAGMQASSRSWVIGSPCPYRLARDIWKLKAGSVFVRHNTLVDVACGEELNVLIAEGDRARSRPT